MFNKRVGRAFHGSGPAEATQHASHERSFAGAEFSGQRHQHFGDESPREADTRGERRGCVAKKDGALFYNYRFDGSVRNVCGG